jgi:hypothetical protein
MPGPAIVEGGIDLAAMQADIGERSVVHHL